MYAAQTAVADPHFIHPAYDGVGPNALRRLAWRLLCRPDAILRCTRTDGSTIVGRVLGFDGYCQLPLKLEYDVPDVGKVQERFALTEFKEVEHAQ